MRSSSTSTRAVVFLVFSAFLGPALFMPGSSLASGDKQKIYVAPFAPLYHQVPIRLGVQTSELVRRELAEQDHLETVEGPTVTEAEGDEDGNDSTRVDRGRVLRRAENLVQQAREQASAQRFDRAARLFRESLSQYEDNLVHVADFSSFVDVHLDLAAALFRAGREEEADGYMSDVLRLDFEREIEGGDYPPAFVERFEAARDRLARSSRGEVSVMTSPPGAEVMLNGEMLGSTPLRLEKVIPGRHYLRVEAPGVEPTVESIDVRSASPTEVELSFGAALEGPVADLVGSLAENRLGSAAMRQLGVVGRDVGVDFILFGVLQRGPRTYSVRTFLFDTGSSDIYRLSDLRIDPDFLGARIEIFRLAEEVAEFVEDPPPAVSVPFTVFDGASQVAITYTTVEAGPPVPRPEPEPRRREIEPEETVVAVADEPERAREPVEPVEPEEPPEPIQPAEPVRPSEPEEPVQPSETARPVEPAEPQEPREPVAPVAPAPEEPEERFERETPVGAHTMSGEPEDEQPMSDRRPFTPVAPVESTPETEVIEEEPSEERHVAQVGGARGRLLDPDLEPSQQRFAAVDIDEVVVVEEDEKVARDGRPWWFWGLAVVGAAGLGAGGWYAATELGGSASSATFTIEW